eukprot:GDKI01000095.1.p1 GENE.GDKI01000095.1~~GDKI01000095.1.p1  ORF type:complete len:152 (+),score=52.67 GDKI01000095.1:1-456(+)
MGCKKLGSGISWPTLKCLLYVYEYAVKKQTQPVGQGQGSITQLKSKTLFALKQLAAASYEVKAFVGDFVLRTVVEELSEARNADYISNALMLLQVLAQMKENCQRMRDQQIELVFESLRQSQPIDTIVDRIQRLEALIRRQTERRQVGSGV